MAGETSNILTVNKSGKYRCYVQHLDGWSGESWTTGEIYIRIEVEAPSIDGGTIGTRTVCDKEEIGFHVLPNYSYLSYQWRVSSDGGASWSNVSGETSSIYNFQVNPEMDGHIYKCRVYNACGSASNERENILNVNPLPEVSLGGDIRICPGSAAVLDPGAGFKEYSWSNGSNTQTAEVIDSGSYSVSVTDNENCINSDTVNVLLDTPVDTIDLGDDQVRCQGDPVILDAGPGFDEYEWSNGSITQSIIASQTDTFSVKVKNMNSVCIGYDTVKITFMEPFQEEKICLVTVNTNNGKNMIVWEKTEGVGTTFYRIYRETAIRDSYVLIGEQSFEALSIFIDTTGKPENQSYLYKITAVDSCGNESLLSSTSFHKTILLNYASSNGGVNIEWSDYEIENGAINFVTYEIWRGSEATSLQKIAEVSSSNNKYIDTDPTALEKLYYYRVVGVKESPCYASGNLKAFEVFKNSFSNLENNQEAIGSTGLNDSQTYRPVSVYPNPARDNLTLLFDARGGSPYTLYIRDLNGKLIQHSDRVINPGYMLSLKDFKPGMYLIELRGESHFRGKFTVY